MYGSRVVLYVDFVEEVSHHILPGTALQLVTLLSYHVLI
jgi:hypothetical protein